MSEPSNNSRRAFIGATAAATVGVLVAPGIRLVEAATPPRPAGEPASSAVRYGLLIDTNKCQTGCTACVSSCNKFNALESSVPEAQKPQWVRKVELTEKATGRHVSLPVMCQHCETPPCVDVCPTGASFKRADGIVLVDRHICIGCRYCMMACPYKARSFVHEVLTNQNPEVPRGKGCVEACNMCVTRVDKGEMPVCVDACTTQGHKAIVFGDLKDPQSEISQRLRSVASSQIRADLHLNTGVRYEGI